MHTCVQVSGLQYVNVQNFCDAKFLMIPNEFRKLQNSETFVFLNLVDLNHVFTNAGLG